jgi:membrane protease YdiL (CAAX protease family)
MAPASLRKWLTPLLPYLAVGIGVFWFRNAWIALLGFHAAIILTLWLARSQFPLKTLFKSNNIRWVLLSILLSGSGGVFLYLFWTSFGITGDLSAHITALGLDSSTWIPFIAYFSLVNPFVEEYFWRGYLGSPTKSLSPSDFIYAGFHAMILAGNVKVLSILYSLIVLVLAGWFWRQVAREDRGLLAPVLGHMAVDFTILVTVYWMSV